MMNVITFMTPRARKNPVFMLYTRLFLKIRGPAGEGMNGITSLSNQLKNGRFISKLIHNDDNLIKVPVSVHQRISGHYSSVVPGLTEGKTVREWLKPQSYETHHSFGIQVLRNTGIGVNER